MGRISISKPHHEKRHRKPMQAQTASTDRDQRSIRLSKIVKVHHESRMSKGALIAVSLIRKQDTVKWLSSFIVPDQDRDTSIS